MRRRTVRTIPLLVGVLGMGIAMLVAPPAANAAGNNVCETSGSFCIGAPTLALNAPVVETVTGRVINIMSQGLPAGQVELQISAAPSLCVAAADGDVNVVLHACQRGQGTVWIEMPPGGSGNPHTFQDREFDTFLAGRDNGTEFKVEGPNVPGFFYRFNVT